MRCVLPRWHIPPSLVRVGPRHHSERERIAGRSSSNGRDDDRRRSVRVRLGAPRRSSIRQCSRFLRASLVADPGRVRGRCPSSRFWGLPARVQDAVSSVVISIGLAAGVWFLVQGVRTRRAEFREQQRDCRNRGAVPPRYFWSPWAIFGWTAALGGLVVVVGGMAVASAIAAMLGFQTQEEVDRASQTAASAITAGIFALVPVAAALGAVALVASAQRTLRAAGFCFLTHSRMDR